MRQKKLLKCFRAYAMRLNNLWTVDCRPWTKKGFTLVEMIIVMAILAIFIGSLFMVFKNSIDTCKKSETRLAIYQNARSILDEMTREISPALIDNLPEEASEKIKFLGFDADDSDKKRSTKDEIYFVASLENSGRYDLCTVGYWLNEDNELMRYFQRDTEENPLDFDFNKNSQNSNELGLNIYDLQFKFHYRSSDAGDWAFTGGSDPTAEDYWLNSSWDSSSESVTNYNANGNEKIPDGLPNAIEVEIIVKDPNIENPEQKDLYTFSTLIYIPQAK